MFSFDSETSDELSLLEKEATSYVFDSFSIDSSSKETCMRMDKKTDKVCNSFAVPSCIEGRSEVKCSKVHSTKTFLQSRTAPYPISPSQETSFASEGIDSCLSSLHEIEFEFDSSPYFSMESYFPQEENRKLKSSSLFPSKVSTPSRKNSSLQSILKMIRIAPSFKSHKSILALVERASSFKNSIPHSSQEDVMKLKIFLLCNMHSSPILREALNRLKELEPRILSPSHASIEEASFASRETSFPSAEPSVLETVSFHPETSPKMHNQSNFKTPRKVLFHKNHASEVKTNIVTPSSP